MNESGCPCASCARRWNRHRLWAAAGQSAADWGSAAADRLAPVLSQAADRVAPLADKALERADRAKSKAAGWAADRVEQWQPGIYSALDRVPPAVGKAHRTLEDKVIPGLVDALHQASGQPIVVVEPAPRRRVGRTIFRIALAGALLATVALVIKTWLSESKRSPWSAHEPHEAYVYPDDNPTASPQASEFETDSYIGPNPPEGFTIKANARSKKYHLPGAPNYDRTIAEVWFPTEEAAQAAGFTKAEG